MSVFVHTRKTVTINDRKISIGTFARLRVFTTSWKDLSEKHCTSLQTEITLGRFDISQYTVTTCAGWAESCQLFAKSH